MIVDARVSPEATSERTVAIVGCLFTRENFSSRLSRRLEIRSRSVDQTGLKKVKREREKERGEKRERGKKR